MNQAIIFNDDHKYNQEKKCWVFTGIFSGQRLTIYINSEQAEISQSDKFEWEDMAEDWLEDNEPDQSNAIFLSLK
jgi:hypothetical protein